MIYDDDFDDPQEALAHYRELLKARQAYKRALQLQSAQYGLAAPPHVVTELKKVRAEIPQLRQKIKQLEGGAAPLSAPSTPTALPVYTHDDPALPGKLPMEFSAYDWEHASQEEAERAVLQTIHNIEQQSPGIFVDDTQIAEALQMPLQDVRDYMDLLEAAGDTKSANSHDGHAAMLTARGRMGRNKLNVTIAAVQFMPESYDGAAIALKLQNRTERAMRVSVFVYLQFGEELVPRRGGTWPTNPQTLAPEDTTSILVPLTIPRPEPHARPQVKNIKLEDGVGRTARVPQNMIERLNDQILNQWPFQEDNQRDQD